MHPEQYPKGIPFEFVLDELDSLDPVVGRMFGCFSIYIGAKIVLILRDRDTSREDNGLWVATTAEHHDSLRAEIPSLRSIAVFGPGPTGWQVIPFESDSFDEDASTICKLIRKRDVRVGKIPAKKRKKSTTKKTKASTVKKPRKSRKPIRK